MILLPTVPPLTRSQRLVFETLRLTTQSVTVTLLHGKNGSGKSTLLKHLHNELGGRYINTADVFDASEHEHPHALDEALQRLLEEALKEHNLVIFDDFSMFETVMVSEMSYPRPYLINIIEKVIFQQARDAEKRIVLGYNSDQLEYRRVKEQAVMVQSIHVSVPDFGLEDYRELLAYWLGEEVLRQFDVEKVYRFESKLTGYQLQQTVLLLQQQGIAAPTAEQFIEVLQRNILVSNVDLAEVEAISKEQLKGAQGLIEQLEKFVILPAREPELAKQLGFKPKRGVLLHGIPGTGKTSIGRMLAHQIRGKFFMIDGTFISDTIEDFFRKVDTVFALARANSPSVVFIDDADLLFTSESVGTVWTRYLLTKLDGLESLSMESVCVIMTAMDVNDIPIPVLRSGRVEVWLETTLPEYETRLEILELYLKNFPRRAGSIDLKTLAQHTEGFTPADLRRIVGDGKAMLAYDVDKKLEVQSGNTYLLAAVDALRTLKNTVARFTHLPELGVTG